MTVFLKGKHETVARKQYVSDMLEAYHIVEDFIDKTGGTATICDGLVVFHWDAKKLYRARNGIEEEEEED